jgi:hypothetical protein
MTENYEVIWHVSFCFFQSLFPRMVLQDKKERSGGNGGIIALLVLQWELRNKV